MVRPLRIVYAGAHYHVISRGNMEHFIFLEEENKKRFVALLGRGAERYKVEVYAYCVMGNHYHLLIQTKEANLPEFMHFLGSSYASYLAKREWKGHIFAGRYKAICIEKEEYFLTLQRYIHLNPVKAGITRKPEEYRWSSYAYFLSGIAMPEWLNSDWMREYFGSDERDCRAGYEEFVEGGIDADYSYPWDKVVAQSVLGSEEFVRRILESQPTLESNEIKGRGILLRQLPLEQIRDNVCGCFGLNDLRDNGSHRNDALRRARKLFIYLAKEYTTATNVIVGETAGNLGPYAIANQYTRIRRRLREDPRFSEEFNRDIDGIIGRIR